MKSDGTLERVLGVWGRGSPAMLPLSLPRPCLTSTAAQHRGGHRVMLGRRRPVLLSPFTSCWDVGAGLVTEGWGQVSKSCSVVGSGGSRVRSSRACSVGQRLAHPQSRDLLCPGVEVSRPKSVPRLLWIAMASQRAWRCLALLPHKLGLVGGEKGKPSSLQAWT